MALWRVNAFVATEHKFIFEAPEGDDAEVLAHMSLNAQYPGGWSLGNVVIEPALDAAVDDIYDCHWTRPKEA